jgi:hypothetical protein
MNKLLPRDKYIDPNVPFNIIFIKLLCNVKYKAQCNIRKV